MSGKKSVALLNWMEALGVAPGIKTLNLVLQNVTKGSNQNSMVVLGLWRRQQAQEAFTTCNLIPSLSI
jgi:hypothetical protein